MKRTVCWIWAAWLIVTLLGCATGGGKGCDAGDSRPTLGDVYEEQYYIKLEPVASSQLQDGRLILHGEMDSETIQRVKTFFDRAKEVDPDADNYCLEAFFELVHERDLGKVSDNIVEIDDWNDYFCGHLRLYTEVESTGAIECIANSHVKTNNGYNDYWFYFENGKREVDGELLDLGFAVGDPRKVRPHLLAGEVSFYLEASTAIQLEDMINVPLYLIYRLNLAQYASRCVPHPAPCEEEGAPAQTPLCGPYAEVDMSQDMSVDMSQDMDAPDLDMGEDMQPADQGADQQIELDQAQDLDEMAEDMAGDAARDLD